MNENETQAVNEQTETTESIESLKAELDRLKVENGKLKNAQSSASADAAKWKKEAREKMDEKARAEAETKELIEQLKAENEAMKRNQGVATRVADFVGVGFDSDLAKRAAEASFDNKHEDFMVALKEFLTAHDKAINADALRNTPRPGVGAGIPSAVTKEQFDKMSYFERVKLHDEQPEVYKELMKK